MSTSATTIDSCKKGSEQTLYYNTADTATPTWVEHIGMIEDLNIGETDDLQEMTGRRASRNVKEYNEGDTDVSITGTQVHDPGYEGWAYLHSARNGGSSRDLLVLSGKITEVNSVGWRGDFWNSDRSQSGPASGNLTNAVNLQPAAQCRSDWAEVRPVKVTTSGAAADWDPSIIP